MTKFKAKGVAFDEVDGYLPENLERRSQLFGISGLKGKYPQAFIVDISTGEELITFIGDSEKMDELLECDDLPEEVLAANPDIPNFNKVFLTCERN